MADQTRNRQVQAEIYGESLDGVVHRLGSTLGLTQAQLAQVIGISAPMLSQLVTARRVKLGNPVAVNRLGALQELAGRVASGAVAAADVPDRLDEIRQVSGQWTLSQPVARLEDTQPSDGGETPRAVHRLLRAVASGQELRNAADLLEPAHPGVAELLRVYGLGSAEEAARHFASHRDL